MKRVTISCLLAAVLLLQAVFTAPRTVAAAATVTGETLAASVGTTFEYRVSISGNPGLTGLGLKLSFDTDALSLVYNGNDVDCVRGDFSQSGTLYCGPTSGGCSIVWTHTSDVATDGTLFVLKLKVNETAALGDYAVRIQNVAQNTVNRAEEQVPLTCVNGTVTVRAYQPLIFGDTVSVEQGKSVDFFVSLQDNPGIASCGAVVRFDAGSLELVPIGADGEYAVKPANGVTQGSLVSRAYSNAIEVFWNAANGTAEEGPLFRLRFRARNTAAPGDCQIAVSCVGENTLNVQEQPVAFAAANGSVKILAPSVAVSGSWDGDALTAAVTVPASATLIAASYDGGGKLLSVKTIAIDGTTQSVPTGLARANGCTYRLMLVDQSTFAPLCGAWSQ